MNDRDRLEQLRALLLRLERMPVSAERDWMLGEVRARAVDVETGVKPAAMRARSTEGAEPETSSASKASRVEAEATVPPATPRRRSASRRPAARAAWGVPRVVPAIAASCPPHPAARRRAAQESVVDLLDEGGVLSLDEPAVADGASRPWSGGLRG
jgi:hypothetical protein